MYMFGRIQYNPAISLANVNPNDPIYKFCMNKGKYNPNGTYNQMALGCNNALPLSKTSKLNTSTNNTGITRRMKYSERVRVYGTTKPSTSSAIKTCTIGGATFSY